MMPPLLATSSTPGDDIDDDDPSAASTTTTTTNDGGIVAKAPSLNGKVVLPIRALLAGLVGHKVAAVYAILEDYDRG